MHTELPLETSPERKQGDITVKVRGMAKQIHKNDSNLKAIAMTVDRIIILGELFFYCKQHS